MFRYDNGVLCSPPCCFEIRRIWMISLLVCSVGPFLLQELEALPFPAMISFLVYSVLTIFVAGTSSSETSFKRRSASFFRRKSKTFRRSDTLWSSQFSLLTKLLSFACPSRLRFPQFSLLVDFLIGKVSVAEFLTLACCVFQPENGCSAHHLLVKIIFFWCFNKYS